MNTQMTAVRAKQSQRGVSLIEVIVVLVIVGVLSSIGVPSFATYMRNMRVASAASDLRSDLLLARSESIRRNSRVLVCPRASATSTACATTASASTWMNGWLVCYDLGADGACDAGSTSDPSLLRVRSAVTSPLALTGPAATVTFFPMGNSNGAATFTLAAGTSSTRSINIAPSGSLTSSKS